MLKFKNKYDFSRLFSYVDIRSFFNHATVQRKSVFCACVIGYRWRNNQLHPLTTIKWRSINSDSAALPSSEIFTAV